MSKYYGWRDSERQRRCEAAHINLSEIRKLDKFCRSYGVDADTDAVPISGRRDFGSGKYSRYHTNFV